MNIKGFTYQQVIAYQYVVVVVILILWLFRDDKLDNCRLLIILFMGIAKR